MPNDQAQIGVIGIAVMGANLARNLSNNKIKTVVYNRTTRKMASFIKEYGNEFLTGEADLKQFVQKIKRPRKILLLVKAGPAVDATIDTLAPYLSKGDIVIDCGNSNYHNTSRRYALLKGKKIKFFGCGISGGEEGALNGPSLMPGGEKKVWKTVKPILETIAAKDFSGKPCVTHIGQGPAGHYVKMVHNGIEYAVMQIMAEAYDILRHVYNLPPEKIKDIFNKLNEGKLNSFLYEIAVKVFQQKDNFGKGFLIDYIKDTAEQKGTGSWTAIDALERGIAIPTIVEAVVARIISSEKKERIKLNNIYKRPNLRTKVKLNEFLKILEDGLFAANIIAYSQGFNLMQKASKEEKWDINLAEVSRIWQGGCIIRAKLLDIIHQEYKSSKKMQNMMELPKISRTLKKNIPQLRKIVTSASESGIPIPCLASALNYFDGVSKENGPANLLQGLRDYFGAHTYQRIDKRGSYHTNWTNK